MKCDPDWVARALSTARLRLDDARRYLRTGRALNWVPDEIGARLGVFCDETLPAAFARETAPELLRRRAAVRALLDRLLTDPPAPEIDSIWKQVVDVWTGRAGTVAAES